MLDFNELHQKALEHGPARFLNIPKDLPNPLAEIPEKRMLIILIDIVGFSKSSTRQQVYDIYFFQKFLISQLIANKLDFSKQIKIVHFIPTGDGCYIIAEDCNPEVALNFLIELIARYKAIQKDSENPRSLRVSAEIGNVVPFIDMAKHLNFIGEGMNEAARILAYGQKALEEKFMEENAEAPLENSKLYSRNSLYLSDAFKNVISNFEKQCERVVTFSQVPDKHGKKRNITVLQNVK